MEQIKTVSGRYIVKRTLLSFGLFACFLVACVFAWKWLQRQPREDEVLKPLRTALYSNEALFRGVFSTSSLTRTFPITHAVKKVRVNGLAGLAGNVDTANWKLKVARQPGDTLYISLDEIKRLPKTEIIFDFKCIEGWSQVTHWAGVKFSDFAAHYNLTAETSLAYTGMQTPDGEYYVGLDNKSMLHPQTLLCYEMNGAPLPMNQGYPLRLIIPVKYGVKHLKRIGTIFFSDARPRDYWFERGYDYYCGL